MNMYSLATFEHSTPLSAIQAVQRVNLLTNHRIAPVERVATSFSRRWSWVENRS